MNQPTGKKRSPAWLRSLGWLGFILLGMLMVLLVAWRLMESSHQKAQALAKPEKTLPKSSSKISVAASSVQKESATSRGIPMAELPLIGIYTGDDLAAQKVLEKQLDEISSWRNTGCMVDGVLSFRAVLSKMGMAVPDTMTEAEAAAEFLKWTERFSAIFAQWREAVSKGPWDFNSLETKDPFAKRGKVFNMAYNLQSLLGAMAEARLRKGDTVAAYSDLQTMDSSADRCGDDLGFSKMMFSWRMLRTARAGMEPGGWTDDQLMGISTMLGGENALASARRLKDYKKLGMTELLTHYRENPSGIEGAKSPIDQMLNQICIATTTDQQIADNLAVINFHLDQPFTRFDPVTGVYLGESADDSPELPHTKPSDVSFDKFYYMYSARYGNPGPQAEWIIKDQSTIDQTRIAAALEIQQRATGEYPATLDAVSGTFGGSTPIDIATGQPYFYQRNPDGGYTLWGTGIDGKSDGGNEKTDAVWKHRSTQKR